MPTQNTLNQFIARVVSGAHVEAIEEFYTPNATMQENQSTPRVGRDVLVAHEKAALARAASVTSTCVAPVFVNGDHVVIRWVFEFTGLDGRKSHIEELAWQRWEGEQIAQETFFYDPVQFKRV
ncbi:MAG: nuclear transport factor 2 family protein [Polaromonas sp.]